MTINKVYTMKLAALAIVTVIISPLSLASVTDAHAQQSCKKSLSRNACQAQQGCTYVEPEKIGYGLKKPGFCKALPVSKSSKKKKRAKK